jgi:hypothetical protein
VPSGPVQHGHVCHLGDRSVKRRAGICMSRPYLSMTEPPLVMNGCYPSLLLDSVTLAFCP